MPTSAPLTSIPASTISQTAPTTAINGGAFRQNPLFLPASSVWLSQDYWDLFSVLCAYYLRCKSTLKMFNSIYLSTLRPYSHPSSTSSLLTSVPQFSATISNWLYSWNIWSVLHKTPSSTVSLPEHSHHNRPDWIVLKLTMHLTAFHFLCLTPWSFLASSRSLIHSLRWEWHQKRPSASLNLNL